MDFLECLNNQIYDFKTDQNHPLWFERIKYHSENFGRLDPWVNSLIDDYKIPFTCNCKFCERVEHVKSINEKLKNRVINLLIDQINDFGHITLGSSNPSDNTDFDKIKLEKYGFSNFSFIQYCDWHFSLKFNFSAPEKQQLILADLNTFFHVKLNWYVGSKANGRFLVDDRSVLSGCITDIDFIDLDNFSDFVSGRLIAIDGMIN